jgi:hypothetical protein
MEVVSSAEMSVNIYQTSRRNIAEDSYLNACHHDNLKLYLFAVYLTTFFQCSKYGPTAPNETVIGEWRIGKVLEESGHGLILR